MYQINEHCLLQKVMAGAAPLDLTRLSERVGLQAEEAKGEGRRLLQHRDAYTDLHSRLLTLTDSMTHQVMVFMF